MRFSTNQLRVLQETLAPPVPHLEAPPELARPAAVQAPQPPPLSFLSLTVPSPEKTTAVPLAAVPALYGCGFCVLLALSLVFPDGWSVGLPLAAVFWPPALALHALSSHHQAPAQAAGLLAACLAAPAAAQPRPESFAAVACLAAAFFALAGSSEQHRRLCAGMGLACACAACAACGAAPALGRQQQWQLWALAAACLAAQAAASSWRLVPFELVCAARAR